MRWKHLEGGKVTEQVRVQKVMVGFGAIAILALSACGGGGGSKASLQSYCQQLKSDWPTLTNASGKATSVWMDAQDPFTPQSQVAQELQPNAALYRNAANLTTSLAAEAPTSIKGAFLTNNARTRFDAMAKAFREAAKGQAKDLGNVDTSGLDAGTTGCTFNLGKPDGTVATLFKPS